MWRPCEDGKILPTDRHTVGGGLTPAAGGDCLRFSTGYGEIRGGVQPDDGREVEFGFHNTNSRHHVHIRLDIDRESDRWFVRQTVTCRTDGGRVEVLTAGAEAAREDQISAFRDGV